MTTENPQPGKNGLPEQAFARLLSLKRQAEKANRGSNYPRGTVFLGNVPQSSRPAQQEKSD